ncbi:MAG: CinA family protein [Chitinispirillia bacterium]|nr:CinA family protein [Chitinispirillia bacterium]MCL2241798.1 CinA family protein [Chitinispirillia bacterium]
MESMVAHLGKIFKSKGLTLAVAESCTGGLLGGAVTSAAGASSYFRGGVIAYDNDIKRDILGVQAADLEGHGAVSGPVVHGMASGAAKLFSADCGVSVSGIAGPGGGTDEKPVGLVFIGIYYQGKAQSRSFTFKGDRSDIRSQSVRAAIEFLIDVVK